MKNIYILITMILFSTVSLFANNIVVLATGGTIAGVADSPAQTSGYKAASLGVDEILESVPELKKIKNINITSEQVLQIASQNFTNEDWLKLAKKVNELAKTHDGIVITHGTDILEETAYFLSLVINTEKPIVLVGAMRPATSISADGPMNLYNAVLVANSDLSRKKGVLVVMNDSIYDARNVIKNNNYKVDAFSSPNTGALGFVHNGEVSFISTLDKTHTYYSEFNIEDIKKLPKVDIFFGSAGANATYIDVARKDKIDAIVYAGSGNGSMSASVEKAMIEARKAGVVIIRSSRIPSGHVARNGEANDDVNNFIASYDLTPQKARILVMLGLTKNKDTKYLQSLFSKY